VLVRRGVEDGAGRSDAYVSSIFLSFEMPYERRHIIAQSYSAYARFYALRRSTQASLSADAGADAASSRYFCRR